MIIGRMMGWGTKITVGGTRPLKPMLGSSGGADGGGIRCGGVGKLWNGGRNLNKLKGGRCMKSGGRLKFDGGSGWSCLGLFIWLWICALKSDGKFTLIILSPPEGCEPFDDWCVLLLMPLLFSAKRADTLRFLRFLWWNMLRESSFDDGKTFIKGFFEERSSGLALLSHDKFAELDVIVDDDEGCDCVTIIFGIAWGFSADEGVGVLDASGVGDLVRQFFSHKSGVIRFSTREGEKSGKLIYDWWWRGDVKKGSKRVVIENKLSFEVTHVLWLLCELGKVCEGEELEEWKVESFSRRLNEVLRV